MWDVATAASQTRQSPLNMFSRLEIEQRPVNKVIQSVGEATPRGFRHPYNCSHS